MSTAPLPALDAEPYLTGNVTQNSEVGPRSAAALGASLGFGPGGRLAGGWAVAVLLQPLVPADFQLYGITLRSGGKLGLPGATPAEDALRPMVHDTVLVEHGGAGYLALQQVALKAMTPKGPGRVVKVLPAIGHSGTAAPRDQYPMGRGGAQWNLIRPCKFRVVMVVDANEIARIPGYSAFIGDSAPYDDRAKLARYLNEV